MNKIQEEKLRKLIRKEIRALDEKYIYDEDKLFNGRPIRIYDKGVGIAVNNGKDFEILGNKELTDLFKKLKSSETSSFRG